jgi:NADPH-dependent curcumin reductase CurA
VVLYKTEDLNQVLAKEYPDGIDVVFESVGGSLLKTCINQSVLIHSKFPN